MTTWNTIVTPGHGVNLVTNGTFDSGISGWTGGSWDSDLQALRIGGTTGAYTTYSFTNGAQYQLTFTVLQGITDHHGAFDIVQGDNSSTNLIVELLQDNLTFNSPYTYTFTANNSVSNPTRLTILCTDGDAFWFDDIKLYALPLSTTTWTSIAAATTKSFTYVNAHVQEQYDQADQTYDQSSDFYDGIDPNYWTNVATPV